MDFFDKYLFEELTMEYTKSNISDDDYEELYQRFCGISHLKEVQPYLYTMRFYGLGTSSEKEAVLSELKECMDEDNYILSGLYYDLRLFASDDEEDDLLQLNRMIAKGYTDIYTKENSHIGKEKGYVQDENEREKVEQEYVYEDSLELEINDQIEYRWPYAWVGMASPNPCVNQLLKAMIEKNVSEMERLFSLGATIDKIDKASFDRALFHLLDDYSVIKCLVDHGFIGAYGEYQYYQKCIEPESYFWGILIRAWYLGNYDVFELLAKNGFNELYICSKGEGYYGEELIIKRNDIKAALILLENGYPRREFEYYASKYPNSKVIQFLKSNPVIHRKTIMLDPFRFKTIEKPTLKKAGFFDSQEVERYNEALMEDYNDRISAQEKFIKSFGKDRWDDVVKEEQESDEFLAIVMDDILKNGF